MKMTTEGKNIFDFLISQKTVLRNDYKNNPSGVLKFYEALKGCSFEELKKLFPAPRAVVEQEIFDATSEIISTQSIEDIASVSMSLFRRKNMEKSDPSLFKKDMQLLQALFFFFLKDICGPQYKQIFEMALKEGEWYTPEKQAELLNQICFGLNFCRTNPFDKIDFTALTGNHFEANESILRLLANFTTENSEDVPKEKIINEINFVREQQKAILQIFPNTRKTDYSDSSAQKEIEQKLINLEKLKQLDFGFEDPSFTQVFFEGDPKLESYFTRKIVCKFFAESNMEWKKGEPAPRNHGRQLKIVARRDDRFTDKSALNHKFLYPERNMITHISENFAVYNLFVKEYNESQMRYWEQLVLYALYDAHEYLAALKSQGSEKDKQVCDKLMEILDHYFVKILAPIDLSVTNEEALWKEIFDENGLIKLQSKELKKTNVFSVLSEREITHLCRFMSLLFCTGNETQDFIEKNKFAIMIYLINLTFELTKLD